MSYQSPTIPLDYSTPPFPSLYWPIRPALGVPRYLYSISDIWRFTLFWTLITFGVTHVSVAIWAMLMQIRGSVIQRRQHGPSSTGLTEKSSPRNTDGSRDDDEPATLLKGLRPTSSPILKTLQWVWLIPVLYLLVGGVEALLAGSVVGLVIGAVYNAGYFKMSTWTPFLWGVINCLVVILGSFRLQGGL